MKEVIFMLAYYLGPPIFLINLYSHTGVGIINLQVAAKHSVKVEPQQPVTTQKKGRKSSPAYPEALSHLPFPGEVLHHKHRHFSTATCTIQFSPGKLTNHP